MSPYFYWQCKQVSQLYYVFPTIASTMIPIVDTQHALVAYAYNENNHKLAVNTCAWLTHVKCQSEHLIHNVDDIHSMQSVIPTNQDIHYGTQDVS